MGSKEEIKKVIKEKYENYGVDAGDNFINILNNLHDIVVCHTANSKVLWANQVAMDEFGISPEDFGDKYCYELFFDCKHNCEGCAVIKARKSGKIEEGEIITPNGKVYLVRAYPIKDNHKKIVGIVEIALDITKGKLLKEKLEFSELKTEFFANLSHDFKTPLNLIFSALQLLDLKLEDEQLKGYVDTINQNGQRLLRLVNNLVDLTKMESNSFSLNLKNHDIVKFVEEVTMSAKEYILDKKRLLQFNTNIQEKVIACDIFSIERVMLNLLSNAVKFTDKGDQIIVNIYERNDKILITVKDTGIGIPEDKQELIFEQFGQVDKSVKRNADGTGIGLSIVKLLVEMHDGQIKVESEYEEGSEFIVELPTKRLSEQDDLQLKEGTLQPEMQDLTNKVEIEFSDIYS
ncbi:sensor histidine kinase [Selenihalanaerobacter shriftii]|uniref:histidine kinase n=1 Tax=Selenihalanaerobacter shriftii TaxID=142842 RepID=A0A1T4LHG8_9FIRM|nr:PAS domain-containing sensor histidine kinase [Selenihalanaerobacter shriftii]SJZ54153.1 PAS domain-containing protein [Selenihalanaerobacter shriftii]